MMKAQYKVYGLAATAPFGECVMGGLAYLVGRQFEFAQNSLWRDGLLGAIPVAIRFVYSRQMETIL